jgi:4-amino-4-deoxy-L-arabinose transferase-like glycosyltransferase
MTTDNNKSKYLRGIWLVAILSGILLLGFALRASFLQSIPGYQVDEGSWNIGARDKLVTGDWCYTIRKFCVAPVHEIIFYLWFLLLNSGLFQARILSVLFSVGSILLMYLIGRKLFNVRTGLIAAAIFAVNYLEIMTGRHAMLETDSTFWVLLAVFLFLETKISYRILASLAMTLAIGTKLYSVKLLPIFAVYDMMPLWGIERLRSLRTLFRLPFLVFLFVIGSGVIIIYGTVYHYYPAEFQFERTCYNQPLSMLPGFFGPDSFWFSTQYFIIRDCLTLLLVLVAVWFLFTKWRKNALANDNGYLRNIWFVFHWTWIAFLGVLLMGYQPPRYYTIVIPAYILLVAIFLDRELFRNLNSTIRLAKKSNLPGFLVLIILLLFSLTGKILFYFIWGQRNTSAPEALTWVKTHIPCTSSIAADYYMAVSLPEYEVWPLHPQRYYALSPGKKLMVDDYFVNPFGIPDYYKHPVPEHFLKRTSDFPDYVLIPVNHGDTGGVERFNRFLRSPLFADNYTMMKEFVDHNGFRTVLFVKNSLSGHNP